MIGNLLTTKVDLYRPSLSKDTTNTQTISGETLLLRGAMVSIQPASTNDQIFYSQRSVEISHTIYADRDYGLQRADLIVYGSRNFNVEGVRNAIELGRVWAIDCKEYQGPDKWR